MFGLGSRTSGTGVILSIVLTYKKSNQYFKFTNVLYPPASTIYVLAGRLISIRLLPLEDMNRTRSRSLGKCSRRPTELCRRNCNQDISLRRPPLIVAVAVTVHPHHIFIDEFADRLNECFYNFGWRSL